MTENEYNIVRQALNRASKMGLDAEGTVELIKMYEDIARDVQGAPLPPAQAFRPATAAPMSPGTLVLSSDGPTPPPPPPVYLSSRVPLDSHEHGLNRTLDECFRDVSSKVPDYVDVLGEGRRIPARFKVEAYRKDGDGMVPPSFGIVFSDFADRSVMVGKTFYSIDKEYDVEKDIAEFVESIKTRYKNAGKVLRPNLPPPTSFSEMERIAAEDKRVWE